MLKNFSKENRQTPGVEERALYRSGSWAAWRCGDAAASLAALPFADGTVLHRCGMPGPGKLQWPHRLLPDPTPMTEASFCVFWSFPFGNVIHQNPVLCDMGQVTNLQQFLSFPQDTCLVYLRVQTCVRGRQVLIGNLLPLRALWMNHNHPELSCARNGIFPSFLFFLHREPVFFWTNIPIHKCPNQSSPLLVRSETSLVNSSAGLPFCPYYS